MTNIHCTNCNSYAHTTEWCPYPKENVAEKAWKEHAKNGQVSVVYGARVFEEESLMKRHPSSLPELEALVNSSLKWCIEFVADAERSPFKENRNEEVRKALNDARNEIIGGIQDYLLYRENKVSHVFRPVKEVEGE